MDSKGWVSIDFLLAFMIIILTIPCITSIISDRIDTANSVREIGEAHILEENIAGTVEMVYSGGTGCSYILKMPSDIANNPYYFTLNSSGLYVRYKNNIGTAFITKMKITDGKYSSNIILEPNKTYNISNVKYKNNCNEIIIKNI